MAGNKISSPTPAVLVDGEAVSETVNAIAVAMTRSIAALGPAMAAYRGDTSPQLARALQAAANVWKGIDAEFGFLTSTQVAELIGHGNANRSLAADQRAAGKLIGIKRGNAYRYPGFQFDQHARTRPVVPKLLQMTRDVGWDEEDLLLWLSSPSGYFHGDRPVDHLDDPDIAEKARQDATVQW